MNNIFKRSLSLLLALMMVISMFPHMSIHAHAHTEEIEEPVGNVVETPAETEPETPTESEAPAEPEASSEPTEPAEPEASSESTEPAATVTPDAPETPAYSEEYLDLQSWIDDMLNYYLGSTSATQAEIEAVAASMNKDDRRIAYVEIYEIFYEAEAVLGEDELIALATNNPVIISFSDELEKYDVVPDMMAGTLATDVDGLTASWTDASSNKGKAEWSSNGTTITGKATGYTQYFVSTKSVTTKLTLKNESGDTATLSFEYTLSGGGSVSGPISGTSGSHSQELANGASVTITLTSPTGSGKTNTLTISGLTLISANAAPVKTTFQTVTGGKYTVDGSAAAVGTTKEATAGTDYKLAATPDSGMMFFGWYNATSKTYISHDSSVKYKAAADATIYPVFTSNTTALFGVGSAKFMDLTEACTYAKTATTKTVVLLNNGTVSGSHTIPSGVTLLIPFNDANTLYTNKPACTSRTANNVAWVKPTAYRTLTLAADAKITVDGAMSLSAQHAAANGGANYCGSPTGPVSFVNMQTGSNITVNDDGNLYAWGYITGSGTVTANSGSTVYENFQITDFRGGSATMAYAKNGLAFPLNQYYVQNIEVPVTFHAGSSEKIYTSAYSSYQCLGGEATFIGNGGMFTSTEGGYVVKDYDESKDRLIVDLYGSCQLSSMKVNLSIEVDSGAYILPITNNVTINIHSGMTTLMQSVALLPGVKLTIDKDAILNLAYTENAINEYCTAGYNIVVYDRDEWFYGIDMNTENFDQVTGVRYGNTLHTSAPVPNGYAAKPSYFVPALYAPGRTGGRTDADLTDAVLDVNGKIIAEGFLYTTIGGASIISSEKSGTIVMQSGAGADMITCQNNGTTSTTLALMIRSAWLKNGDGSYLETMSFDDETGDPTYVAEPDTIFSYCATHDQWYTGECVDCAAPQTIVITWKNGSDTIYTEEDHISGTVPAFKSENPTKASDASGHYQFAGWSITENGAAVTQMPAVTENTTFYAVYTAEAHNGTDDGDCTSEVKCSCGYVTVQAKTEHTFTVTQSETKATCMATGTLVKKCANCTKTSTETLPIDKTNHTGNNTTGVNAKPATCTAEGYTGDTVCECGVTIENGTSIKKLDHTFTNKQGDLKTEGTCVAEAVYAVECDVCGTDSETLEVKGAKNPAKHTGNNTTGVNAKPATCTAEGYTGDTVCECGTVIVKGEIIPVEKHTFTNKQGDLKTEGTCVAEAVYAAECDVCGTDSETLEVKGAKNPAKHTSNEFIYKKLDDNKHSVSYKCCEKQVSIVDHKYVDGVCVCNAVAFYTITWVDGDGKTVGTTEVNHGAMPVYNGNTPTKTATAQYSYEWNKGWTPAVVEATTNTTYTATFSEILNMYEITWKVDGQEEKQEFAYGATPVYSGNAADAHPCDILSWTPAIESVTGNATYTAVWTENKDAHKDEAAPFHFCDFCEKKLSDCSDASGDGDHNCDICDEENISNCVASDAVRENIVEATCGKDGSYDSVVYCSECKAEISREKMTIPATGEHNYTTEVSHTDATCMAEGSVTKKCACGAEDTETLVIDKSNHTKQNTTVKDAVDVTCGADGYTGDTYCECGEKIADGETIPATGEHTYTFDCDKVCKVCNVETRPNAAHVSNAAYTCVDGSCVYCEIEMPATTDHSFTNSYHNNGDTHSATCVCGTEIFNQPHVYDETTHKCVCEDVEEFTLTFTINGEAYGEPVKVEFGAAVTAPAYTIPEGHTFSGWDVPATMPGKDLTIDATLTPNPYTVTLSGDCVTMDAVTAYHGQKLVVRLHNDTGSSNRGVELRQVRVNSQIIDENEYTFDENNTLTIPGELITGNVSISAEACVNVTIDINGAEVYLHELAQGLTIEQLKAMLAEYCGYTEGSDIVNVYGVTYGSNNYAVLREFLTFFNKPHHNFGGFKTQNGTILEPNEVGAVQIDGDMQLTMLWEIEKFTLTVVDIAGEEHVLEVPYGTNIVAFLKDQAFYDEEYELNSEDMTGILTFVSWLDENNEDIQDDAVVTGDMSVYANSWHTGWIKGDLGWGYEIDNSFVSGWQQIHGDWYYLFLDKESGWSYRAEGTERVPYPTKPINGITYEPDADAKAYYESKGETFIDAEEAWFMFDYTDGKFQYDFNGVSRQANPYAENGMFVWHPGVVEHSTGRYYYFIGDTKYGGNDYARNADVYVQKVTKNNSKTIDFVIGGVYTTDEYGWICNYDGIIDMADGTKRYYENARLMVGNGLTKVGENFIYVNRNGNLVVNGQYWVSKINGYDFEEGMYEFDENGFLVIHEVVEKHGVYFENDAWYYYENGSLARNKGLIKTDLNWYDADGKVVNVGGTIYVRSNGVLATGRYWITNVENYDGTDFLSGNCYQFNTLGIAQAVKHGIVNENGILYYYQNNMRQYNAGVIELNGNYYYVRSNAQLAVGKYWVTKTNDMVVAKQYTFDENGVMQNPETEIKNGIVDGFYYVDGKLQYAAGVVYLENEGCYIYVRSNGEVATGSYWATNTNGLLESKMYDWGTDGKLYL